MPLISNESGYHRVWGFSRYQSAYETSQLIPKKIYYSESNLIINSLGANEPGFYPLGESIARIYCSL